eukprot:5427086-Amphidinium_carterae.1
MGVLCVKQPDKGMFYGLLRATQVLVWGVVHKLNCGRLCRSNRGAVDPLGVSPFAESWDCVKCETNGGDGEGVGLCCATYVTKQFRSPYVQIVRICGKVFGVRPSSIVPH